MTARWNAVLFDRDETLCITDSHVYREAGAWAAERFGLDAGQTARTMVQYWSEQLATWQHLRTPADESRFWEAYTTELASRLRIQPAQGSEFLSRFPYEAFLRPVPNVREVLLDLRTLGVSIGVLSNSFPSIDRTLSALGIADLVDTALASCTLGVHKPDHAAFELAAEALGLPTQEILFLDDRQENVDAAREVGMSAGKVDLHQPDGDAIHDLREVVELVKQNHADTASAAHP